MASIDARWKLVEREASRWQEDWNWKEDRMKLVRSVERLLRFTSEDGSDWKRNKSVHLFLRRVEDLLRKVKLDAKAEEEWMDAVEDTISWMKDQLERPCVSLYFSDERSKDGIQPDSIGLDTSQPGPGENSMRKGSLRRRIKKIESMESSSSQLDAEPIGAGDDNAFQDREQEEMKDELIHLVQGIKKNALLAEESLKTRANNLDEYETSVDRSLAGARYGNQKQDMLLKRGRGSLCLKLAMMCIVSVVFLFTYMVIKIT